MNEIHIIENEFSSIINNDSVRKFNILILKANCFKEIKKYSNAISIYLSILNSIDDSYIESRMFILCNLMETYIELEDTKNLKIFLDKCLKLMKQYNNLSNNQYECQIYNDIALAANFLKNAEMATEYYYKSLNSALEYNNYRIILDDFNSLLNIFNKSKNFIGIDSIRNQFCEMVSLNKISPFNLFTLKLVSFYNSCGDIESSNNFINFCIKSNN